MMQMKIKFISIYTHGTEPDVIKVVLEQTKPM